MSKSDPEFKTFKENYDKVIPYFMDRFKFITDELVHEIFNELNDRQDELVNVLSRNMLDFCDLIKFFASCMKQINPLITVGGGASGEGDENNNENKGKNTF